MVAERVDLIRNDTGFIKVPDDIALSDPNIATHRVPRRLYEQYAAAYSNLVGLEQRIIATATTPVYVTPDQEAAVRAIAKPDAWIVVREEAARDVASVPVDEPTTSQEPVPPAVVPPVSPDDEFADPANPPVEETPQPKRPPIGRCEQRGGLPHAVLRYVLTESPSEFYPGRTRIDGLCQCGERIPDVKCPHQKQEPDALKRPRCAWCKKLIIGSVGVIDNRKPQGYGGGSPDPNVRTPVPINAGKGDSFPEAYRAPE